MKTPFTLEQFLEVFKNYNLTVWPMQVVFYLLAIAVIFFSLKKFIYSNPVINIILSFFWLWIGVVYHIIYFSGINKAAYVFGGIFILHGFIFLFYGVFKSKISFHFRYDINNIIGALMILYALIVYPFLGYFLGHRYPYSPTFGLPCPTTIFTFGILLTANRKVPVLVLIIPVIWSVIGFFAAISFGILEDTGLLVSGILAAILILRNNKYQENN